MHLFSFAHSVGVSCYESTSITGQCTGLRPAHSLKAPGGFWVGWVVMLHSGLLCFISYYWFNNEAVLLLVGGWR